MTRSEEHTSELQSHSDLHSFPTRRSSDLGMGNQKDLENILICQKKAIRIINKLNNREHCKPFFKKNKILTLISLYIYETILLTKKVPVKTRETFHDQIGRAHV